MKVLHISAECYPVAKVGGLADVVGSLPKYQNKLGTKAGVVMPYYQNTALLKNKETIDYACTVDLGETRYEAVVLKLDAQIEYPLYRVKIPGLLDRKNVYGYSDDTERFLAFQKVVLDWILQFETKPEILHCHDHHTGLIPFMASKAHKYQPLSEIPSVLTIHNAQYQGAFSFNKLHYFPPYDLSHSGLLEWDEQINPLAAAIKCAWKVTTVSPSYLKELRLAANGLEWLLDHEKDKSSGILNGIDTDVWNPETDPMISRNYNAKTIVSGKRNNKRFLCDRFELDPQKPLFAFIGRLVGEKGAELLPHIFKKALEANDLELNLLILGSGNHDIERELKDLKPLFKGNYNAFIGYDEKLSHLIYAGADFLLMPSRVEPCGLNQMYALRYGTLPIVSAVGGLKDTVVDIDTENGFGICHEQVSVEEAFRAIKRGCKLYREPTRFKKICKQIMQIDHSWECAAINYLELYKSFIHPN